MEEERRGGMGNAERVGKKKSVEVVRKVSSSCLAINVRPTKHPVTHLQPNDDQVPKSYHTNLHRTSTLPSTPPTLILDSYNVHRMKYYLHRQQARQESNRVTDQ